MAVDDQRTEYHLTPEGWIKGTVRFFGKGRKVEHPPGAVETWEHHIYQRSRWSAEEPAKRLVWCDESVSEAHRQTLRESFPPPF